MIGSAPSWKPGAVKRYYSFAKSDITGTPDKVITTLSYLDSEINSPETDATKLVLWDAHNGPTWNPVEPHGKSNNSVMNRWVELSGLSINYIAPLSSFDNKQWSLAYSNLIKNTWLGMSDINPTQWDIVEHWSGGHIPLTSEDVLIPSGKANYPTLTINIESKSLEIESGASLNAGSYNITINGYTGAWINNGTFNHGTSTVIFSHSNNTHVITLSGTTDFYNLQVGSTAWVQNTSESTLGISGAVTNIIIAR